MGGTAATFTFDAALANKTLGSTTINDVTVNQSDTYMGSYDFEL